MITDYGQFYFDLHTHTIASGHGTFDTAEELFKSAAKKSLLSLGISDHAPAYPGSCRESYFRNLPLAPSVRFGINAYYGVELNILNKEGDIDLSPEILNKLDYAIISLHTRVTAPMSCSDNTAAYINAMRHPKVMILGHPDDDTYPVDYESLLHAAKEKSVFPEINNSSLRQDSGRINSHRNIKTILHLSKKLDLPVLLSSDSHGRRNIGDFSNIIPLLKDTDFPRELILNTRKSLHLIRHE